MREQASSVATATRWATITPHDTNELDIYKAAYCIVAGDIAAVGHDDVQVNFPVIAGQIFPGQIKILKAAGTTATIAGMY